MNNNLNEIKELINKKQYLNAQRKSLDLLKKLISVGNKEQTINCYLLLAESYSKDIKNIKAMEELNKALEKFPFEPEILEAIYDISSKLKRKNDSEIVLKELLMIQPENISYILSLVKIYLSNENYIEASRVLNILISQGNYSLTVNSLASFCYEKLNLYSEQLKQIKILQEMNPENYEMYFKEVEVLITMGEYNESADLLISLLDTYQEVKDIDKIWIEKIIYFSKFLYDLGLKDELLKRLSLIDFNKIDIKTKNMIIEKLKSSKLDIFFSLQNLSDYTSEELIETTIYNSDYFENNSKKLKIKTSDLDVESYTKFLCQIF